ncbi:UPF0554 protein C2orf43-like [Tropilaelaps mercedesae]|uniref:Lipid droplet-associated hydrolase n=1 Tax=Tropilaelaps mercedesae TaxID=418985 RepID=A0A1V9X018_9ACAR|nr:UPF0554 protein C2orf43-like [Tropilaelaps mercedesae]
MSGTRPPLASPNSKARLPARYVSRLTVVCARPGERPQLLLKSLHRISMDFNVKYVSCRSNPGEIQYYEEFLRQLYGHFEEQVEIVGISHAGHHAPPAIALTSQAGDASEFQEFPSVDEHPELYDLQAQILHKIEYIKKFVGFDREIILVGHSIGAYVAMQVIKREPRLKVCS